MSAMRRVLLWAAVAGLLAVSNVSAAIMLDVGSSTSPVMSGWTKVCDLNDYAHTTSQTKSTGVYYQGSVNLGSGVTVGFDNGYNWGATDRGDISGNALHALGLDELLRDFVNTSSSSTSKLQVKGLTPGGSYFVTVYSADANYLAEYAKVFDVNGTAVTVGPPTTSPTLAKVSATVTVAADASGVINIGRNSTFGNSIKINGVVIMPTPEPVSLVLVLTGIGVGLIRRR